MDSTLSVRRAKAEDAALIRRMRIASLTESPHAFGARLCDVQAQPEKSFEEDARRHSTSEVSTSFFVFSGAEPVGTIGAFFERSESQRAFICALWVDPSCRGTSAASLLVAAAIEWLSDRGAENIFAWVANDNARAQAFYRKAGFSATSEVQPLPSKPSKLETLFCGSAHGG